MSIVFEAYSGPTTVGGDGNGALPRLRGQARATAYTGGVGVGRLRFAGRATGLSSGIGNAALPLLRGLAGPGTRRGHGALPRLAGYASGALVHPELAIQVAPLPHISGQASGHAVARGTANGALPRLRSRSGVLGASFGRAALPRLAGQGGRVPAPTQYLYAVQSAGALYAYASESDGPIHGLIDRIGLTDQTLPAWITRVLLSAIGVSDTPLPLAETLGRIESTVGLRNVVEAVLALTLADTLGLDAAAGAAELRLLALADTVALAAAPVNTREVTELLATILALSDSTVHPTIEALSAGFGLSAALAADVLALAQAQTALRLSATLNGDLLLTALLRTTVGMDATPTTTAEVLHLLRDALGFSATLALADEAATAWVMDLASKAAWTYDNYPFNSFATLGGMQLAAGPEGIMELAGDTDAGTPIAWLARTGLSNLGTLRLKRPDAMYLGLTSAGEVGLSVIVTDPVDGEKVQYNYTLPARQAAAVVNDRLKLGQGIESVYFAFQFVGTGPFTLNDAQLLMRPTGRRK